MELQLPVKVAVAILVDGHVDAGLLSIDKNLDLAALTRFEETLKGGELANLKKG